MFPAADGDLVHLGDGMVHINEKWFVFGAQFADPVLDTSTHVETSLIEGQLNVHKFFDWYNTCFVRTIKRCWPHVQAPIVPIAAYGRLRAFSYYSGVPPMTAYR